MVLLDLALFGIAMLLLVLSSRKVIDSAIKISEYTGISQLAIGFIVIAIAVSMPDLMVAVTASLAGKTDMAIGDALGSSIANICLVLGIATLIRRIDVERKHTLESTELLLLISVVPAVILSRGIVGPFEGLVLLIIFVFYCFFILKDKFSLKVKDGVTPKEWKWAIIIFFLGMSVVIVSSRLVVEYGANLAGFLGISEAVIGMTLIAFGTTLPELALDFTAIRRGHTALAIGDILGSTVVNLTLILGVAITITPALIDFNSYTLPLAFIIIANTFLFYNLVKHECIGSKQGILFLLFYIVFIMLSLISNFI